MFHADRHGRTRRQYEDSIRDSRIERETAAQSLYKAVEQKISIKISCGGIAALPLRSGQTQA